MPLNKFEEKKVEAEILGEIYNDVSRTEKNFHQKFTKIGKTNKQATDYKTKELLWEDAEKTIPKYEDDYGYVQIPDSELSDETRVKIRVCRNIMSSIEKML